MSEVKDKLITAENLKNAYDDNKRKIDELKADLSELDNEIIVRGANRFNAKTSKNGYWFEDNGSIFYDGDLKYSISDFIKIKPNTSYGIYRGIKIAYFDKDKKPLEIREISTNGSVQVSPSTAYYCSIGYMVVSENVVCVVEGTEIPTYTPFEDYISEELIGKYIDRIEEYLKEKVFVSVVDSDIKYALGDLTTSGSYLSNQTGVRFKEPIFLSKGSTIAVNTEGYIFNVGLYTKSDEKFTFVSGSYAKFTAPNTYTLKTDSYVMCSMWRTDNSYFVNTDESSNIIVTKVVPVNEAVEDLIKPVTSAFDKWDLSYFAPFSYANYKGMQAEYDTETLGANTSFNVAIAKFNELASANSGYITKEDLGVSSDGTNHIFSYTLIPKTLNYSAKKLPTIIIVAGQHGFEKASVYGLYYFLKDLCEKWYENPVLDYIRNHVCLKVIPIANPYGFNNNSYLNANGVNLNRNYDTSGFPAFPNAVAGEANYGGESAFSELETQHIRDFVLENLDASFLIDFHTNGRTSVAEYSKVNLLDFPAFKDEYRLKFIELAYSHTENITAHFKRDYSLNTSEMCGSITNGVDYGADFPTLDAWANTKNVVGHCFEGFAGFPNGGDYDANCLKANSELIGNWLGYVLAVLT